MEWRALTLNVYILPAPLSIGDMPNSNTAIHKVRRRYPMIVFKNVIGSYTNPVPAGKCRISQEASPPHLTYGTFIPHNNLGHLSDGLFSSALYRSTFFHSNAAISLLCNIYSAWLYAEFFIMEYPYSFS